MKVVYVIDSLASKGGAERILSDKMNYMTTHYGYEVFVITCYQDQQKMHNAYFLEDSVKQINLNIPYYSQYNYGYPKRLWIKWSLYRRLICELTVTIQDLDPDVLIGLGYFMADVVCAVKCRAAKIVESHEARIFTMSDCGLNRSFLSRAYMKFYRKQYFRRVESHADVVVTLTTGDAKEWYRAKRVEVIPNFTVLPVVKLSTCENKQVLAVGRLEWQKGFDCLIEVWAIVSRKHPDWQLTILGSGTHEESLKQQICSLKLNNIAIRPFTPAINKYYSESSVFALSSRFEGFGLVLLEAMQNGLPCVAFDCPYGPGDIVADNRTGYVVHNGDIELFADRLCRLIEDDRLRKSFGNASVDRAKAYAVDVVMSKWKSLIEGISHPLA